MRQEQEQRCGLIGELRALLDQLYIKDIEPAEIGLILAELYWAAVLLWPWRDTFSTSPGYAAMAHIAREEVWGAGALALALLPIAAFVTRSITVRALGLLLSVMWWTFVTVMLVSANRYGTGGVYSLGILGGAWAFRRVLADHGDEIAVVRWLRARYEGRGE